MSYQLWCDVITSHHSWYDVVSISCVCLEVRLGIYCNRYNGFNLTVFSSFQLCKTMKPDLEQNFPASLARSVGSYSIEQIISSYTHVYIQERNLTFASSVEKVLPLSKAWQDTWRYILQRAVIDVHICVNIQNRWQCGKSLAPKQSMTFRTSKAASLRCICRCLVTRHLQIHLKEAAFDVHMRSHTVWKKFGC